MLRFVMDTKEAKVSNGDKKWSMFDAPAGDVVAGLTDETGNSITYGQAEAEYRKLLGQYGLPSGEGMIATKRIVPHLTAKLYARIVELEAKVKELETLLATATEPKLDE